MMLLRDTKSNQALSSSITHGIEQDEKTEKKKLVAERTQHKHEGSSPVKMIKASNVRDDIWSQTLEHIGLTKDEQAYQKLFQHFAPLIKGFVQANNNRLTPDSAEELVQEVMVKVWLKAPLYSASKSSASTWIFTITRNARIDYFRKHNRHDKNSQTLEAEDIWDEESENEPFVYLNQIRAEKITAGLLKELPLEQARCLRKVYMEGKSHSEIANELDLPLGTVKSRVRLGLKKLQDSVARTK